LGVAGAVNMDDEQVELLLDGRKGLSPTFDGTAHARNVRPAITKRLSVN